MKILNELLATLAVFSLLFFTGNPLFAFDGKDANPETKNVKDKLLEKGLDDIQVVKKIQTMSDADLSYFASHPERLQVAGNGITTQEAILGLLFIAVGVVIVAVMAESNGF